MEYRDRFGTLHKTLDIVSPIGKYTDDIVIKKVSKPYKYNGKLYGYLDDSWIFLGSCNDSNNDYDLKYNYKEITINRCPSCGAPLKPGETKCSYCDSWFQL